MDVNSEPTTESAFEPPPVLLPEGFAAPQDQHAEINARRAQVENAELLRRLRSL